MSHAPVFRTIREQIAERIRADVISGRLPEGTSLCEQALARQYGVSRAPIRDALLQLTQEGLLVAKPNCGVRVGSPSGEEIQPLVVELRRKIEVFALRKVFSKLTDGDVKRLEDIGSFDEALQLANDSDYGLAAYIFTHDMRRIQRLVHELDFGEICVNRPIGEQRQGFHNGFKLSGTGGEDGKYGLENYLQKKTFYVNFD